jgi:hypothetical protein
MNDLSLSNKSLAKTFRKRWGSVWQQGLMNCANDGESDKQSQKIGAKQKTGDLLGCSLPMLISIFSASFLPSARNRFVRLYEQSGMQ